MQNMTKGYGFALDDNPRRLAEVADLLRELNYEPIRASTLDQAIQKMREEVLVVVSDLDLSNGRLFSGRHFDGYKFLKWLYGQQAEGRYPDIQKVILYSTFFNTWSSGTIIYPVKAHLRNSVENMGYRVVPKEEGTEGLARILKQ